MQKVLDQQGKEVKGIVRSSNGSLIHTDLSAYENYKKIKDFKTDEKSRITNLEKEIDDLKKIIQKLIS